MHVSARHDALSAARQRAFIAPRLFAGMLALAALPIYLALRGAPDAQEMILFAWFSAPLLIGCYVSYTGRLERAQVLSVLALSGLGLCLATTGGALSAAALWLFVALLEAALCASLRAARDCLTIPLSAAGFLAALAFANLLPDASDADHELIALSVAAAALYGAAIAFGVFSLMRTSAALLRAQQDRYRQLACVMTDALIRHDADGAVRYASPAAEAMFASNARDLLGHGLYERVHVADRPAYRIALGEAAALGKTCTIALRIRRDASSSSLDASFVWVEMRCQPLDSIAHVVRSQREVLAVMRDITTQKIQEQTVADMRTELAHATSANGELLAKLGHELRTPLNAIIGFSQVLSNHAHAEHDIAQWHSYARLINEAGCHLLSVIDGMLDVAKLESGEITVAPEWIEPASIISTCCDLLAMEIRRAGLGLSMRLDEQLPAMMADPRAFRQILINLVGNAVKYTDRGGRIVVGAHRNGSALVLTVEDTGIGIAREDIARLGDPFFQTRAAAARRPDGSGLGLFIVKGLVALHGGEVDIASRIGKGTCVTVRLPLAHKVVGEAETVPDDAKRRALAGAVVVSNDRVKKSASA